MILLRVFATLTAFVDGGAAKPFLDSRNGPNENAARAAANLPGIS
jgi:hypothetical protein